MTEARAILAVLVVALFAATFVRNKDVLSPVKFYFLYSVFFYVGLFTTAVRWETLAVYLLLLVSILLSQSIESRAPVLLKRSAVVPRSIYLLIWLLTLPGLIVKAWLISSSGGIIEYIASLAFRVEEWKGKGPLIVWFYIIPVLNLVYFSYLLIDRHCTRAAKAAYLVHFATFIGIGLLTGSRSYIAIPVVGMVVAYAYLKERISPIAVAITILFVIGLVSVLGATRNTFGSSDPEAFGEALFSAETLDFEHLHYGTTPLEIVFASTDHAPHLGATYASLFTNFIPRAIFPEKFDTGGIVFTREYAGDQWGGLSHLATGSVTEGILNFGMELGVLIGVALNLVIFCLGVLWYNKIKVAYRNGRGRSIVLPVDLAIYFYFVLGAARLSFSEFTNVFHSFVIYALIPCVVVRFMATRLARRSFRIGAAPTPVGWRRHEANAPAP